MHYSRCQSAHHFKSNKNIQKHPNPLNAFVVGSKQQQLVEMRKPELI